MELSQQQQRVLGVLIEKSLSQPGSYPLTVNAVRLGCNQRSNRNPVLELQEADVLEALDGLRSKGLAGVVVRETGRTERWEHRAAERWNLDEQELGVLAELLLRGPQTEGEIRSHVTRMRPIASIEEAHRILEVLAGREEPLAVSMGKQPGKRGIRYRHALYPEGEVPQAVGGPEAGTLSQLYDQVSALQQEVASLKQRIEALEGRG